MSTIKTTLEMPSALFRRAKATAATRGQTLKQLVTSALDRELRLSEPGTAKAGASVVRTVRKLAAENAAKWLTGHGAVDAVREQRRG